MTERKIIFWIMALILEMKNVSCTLFSLNEYFNLTNATKIDVDKYLCHEVNTETKCCSCRDEVFLTKTSCIDNLWNQTIPILLKDHIEMLVKTSKQLKNTVCEQVVPVATNSGHTSVEILMVHSCLQTANKQDIELCLNNKNLSPMTNVPVLGSDKIVYRNYACAKCNSIWDFKALNLSIQCASKTDETSKTLNNETKGILDKFRKCMINIGERDISHCPDYKNIACRPDNFYIDACNSYSGIFLNYKSYNCYSCDYLHTDVKKDLSECKEKAAFAWTRSFSWSITIGKNDVSVNGNKHIFDSEERMCAASYRYDVLSGTCEAIICSDGYKLSGSNCELESATIDNAEESNFNTCLLGQQPGFFLIVNSATNVSILEKIFAKRTNSSEKIIKLDLVLENRTLYKIIGVSWKTLNALYIDDPIFFKLATSIIISSVNNQRITEMYGFDVSRNFRGNQLCAQPETYEVSAAKVTNSCDYQAQKTIKSDDIVFWMELNETHTIQRVSYCKLFHLRSPCPLEKVTKDYRVDINQTLIRNLLNVSYYFFTDQYVPLSQGVGVCENTKLTLNQETVFNKIGYIISVVGTTASMPCYLFVTITYLYFKELRTTTSLSSTTLCAVLFVADSIFLTATQVNGNKRWCRAISVMLHWALLTVYHCVLFLAVDMAKRFGTSALRTSHKKRLFAYAAVVYANPFVIVMVTFSLDQTGIAYVGYGGNGFCWIDGVNARLISYVVPVAIILVSASFTLLFTLYKINKSEKESQKIFGVARMCHVNVVMVAIKLTLMLGITEIVGFIQIYKTSLSENEKTFNSVFAILFTFFRSTKGIMLLIVYIFNKKMMNIYRKSTAKFHSREKEATRRCSLK